jgi:hypothetical protein
MTQRILIAIALLAMATLAKAEDLSPLFGSATQEPVQIAIDPNTGLPLIAEVEQPQPVVAARE